MTVLARRHTLRGTASSSTGLTRRSFGRRVLGTGAGIAAAGLFSKGTLDAQPTDLDILNFALNLEYLEAEFYTVITTGLTLTQTGIGTSGTGMSGPTTGASKLSLNPTVQALAQDIATDEQNHVTLLRAALGPAAIAKPTINFSGAKVVDELSFLLAARLFEDVGVSAYGGAAPLISSPAILGTAARILATEAEHTGGVRELIYQWTILRPTAIDALDLVDRVFSVDRTTGLTAIRTPSQVLAIVFQNASPGTTAGGLFPNGVNGLINTV